MVPIHRQKASASVAFPRKRQRDHISLDHVISPFLTDRPAAKKPRTQNQCFPGGHIEVWNFHAAVEPESSEVVWPREIFDPTPDHIRTTTEHQTAQQRQLCVPVLPERGLFPAEEIIGSGIFPLYHNSSSYEADSLEGWLLEPLISRSVQDPPFLFQSSPSVSQSSIKASPISSHGTAHIDWSSIISQTLSSPELCGETIAETGPLLQAQFSTPQIGSANLVGPISCPSAAPTDFLYFPWTATDQLNMGGGEHYPAPRHVALPTSQPPSEEVDGQIPRPHQPWLTQQPESSIPPSELAWTDMGIPVQPSLQQALNNCSPPLSHLVGEEQHLRNDPNSGHASQRKPLVLRPRQNSDQSSHDTPDIKEELLTAPHDNQGALERCTCDTQPVNVRCRQCSNANISNSWVIVSHESLNATKQSDKEDKKPRKPRKRLEESERQQTSRTREVGACVRCKIQRVRCTPNDNDPAGPCEGCLRVALNQSKKVRYHIGCHRYKLQEVVLFRTSGSKVTDRWHGAQVRNVVTQGRVRSVQMCQEGIDAPFIFEVRKLPKASRDSYNDQDKRVWFTGIGLDREEIAGFGLANVHETILRYKAYIHISVLGNENCQPAIQPAIQKVANEFRKLNYDVAVVGEVFQKAWDYFCSLPDNDQGHDFYPPMGKKLPIISEKQFLFGFFELWFALRHSMGWSWIKEKLPGTEVIERFPPLKGEFATPRVVVGQIDCIRISCVLKPLTKSLLKVLMKWIAERNYDCWMSIFFATFMLLSELAKATEDAYHHGWYDKDIKGEGPKHVHIIRDIHESANIILAHWHYYNYSTNPLEFSLHHQGTRNKTPLRALTADQLAVVQNLWEEIHQWKQRQNENELYDNKNEQWWRKWCHPLYFAESMFDSSWKPREVFSG